MTNVIKLAGYKAPRIVPDEIELEADALRGLEANPRCVKLSDPAAELYAKQRAEMLSFGQTTILLAVACLICWGGIGAALVWYLNGGAW